MHGHLDQRDGGDSDVFEVVRIRSPWSRVCDLFLFLAVVVVEGVAGGVDELDGVFDF